MKKTLLMMAAATAAMFANAATEVVDGVTWNYSISGNKATITSGGTYQGDLVIPQQLGGCDVVSIGTSAFKSCGKLKSIALPATLTTINREAFCFCGALKSIVIPDTVTTLGNSSFYCCSSLSYVKLSDNITAIGGDTFAGCGSLSKIILPKRIASIADWAFNNSGSLAEIVIPEEVTTLSVGSKAFSGCPASSVICHGSLPKSFSHASFPNAIFRFYRSNASSWKAVLPTTKTGHYLDQDNDTMLTMLSSSIRESDPTILDVVYRVVSDRPLVKVRALAFEDGTRSFAKVVRPETFIEETDANIGDSVESNVDHTLSWKVSEDWQTRLAKVKFEVLVSDGELLPCELRTIPASEAYGPMEFSWNALTASQVFDALLWLYADRDAGLTLSNGVLKNGGTQLASGTGLSNPNAVRYLFSKMGYNLLSGTELNYVNSETRLGLSPSGVRQYAYRIEADGE